MTSINGASEKRSEIALHEPRMDGVWRIALQRWINLTQDVMEVKHVGLLVLVSIIFIAFSLVSSNWINQYLRWQPLSTQHVNNCWNFLFSISTFVVTRYDSIFRFIAPATKRKKRNKSQTKKRFCFIFFQQIFELDNSHWREEPSSSAMRYIQLPNEALKSDLK